MLQVGDTAPDFELLTDEENPVKLSDYRGQTVVLFFYPKADTPGCTIQACGFRDNYPVFTSSDAVVFGISPDTPADLAKWRAQQGFPYNLLADLDHQVIESYGLWGEKEYAGKKYIGVIRSHYIIDNEGKIADVQVNVSPQDSVDRAMAFVESK